MKLIPNETEIISDKNGIVVLTNYRIWNLNKGLGRRYTISIPLEKISSVELMFTSWVFALIVGILLILCGVYFLGVSEGDYLNIQSNRLAFSSFFIAIIALIVWWLSRQHIVKITSDGGPKMELLIESIGKEKVDEFICTIMTARQIRMEHLA